MVEALAVLIFVFGKIYPSYILGMIIITICFVIFKNRFRLKYSNTIELTIIILWSISLAIHIISIFNYMNEQGEWGGGLVFISPFGFVISIPLMIVTCIILVVTSKNKVVCIICHVSSVILSPLIICLYYLIF